MPINPTTLKALIDTQITNETVDFAITPAEVGGRMKDAIDYTTEQINGVSSSAKSVKVTITYAQLLLLNTNPKEILPAVSGKAYLPLHFLFKYNNNGGWGNSGSPWTASLGSTNLGSFSIQIGGGSITEQINLGTGGNSSTTDTYFNKSISIQSTSNLSGAVNTNCTCDIYLTYYEIAI
jgi:hypothetical protein